MTAKLDKLMVLSLSSVERPRTVFKVYMWEREREKYVWLLPRDQENFTHSGMCGSWLGGGIILMIYGQLH